MNSQQRWIGFAEVIASGACFGMLGFFGKKSYQAGISPGEFLSLRFVVSALILGTFLAFKNPKSLRVKMKPMLHFIALGVLGYSVFASCYFYALTGLSASLTVLLLYLYPVFVTLGGRFFLNEKLGFWGDVALPIAIVGLTGLVWGEWRVSSSVSLLLGLGSAVFYALYILCSRVWLRNQNSYVATFYIQVAAGILLSLIHFKSVGRPIQIFNESWPLILGVAVICSLLAMTLFLSGLKKLTGAETSILSTSEPITGILIATFFLGESLRPIQIGGGALVLLSMVLVSISRPGHSKKI
ncbi:DMT family transporter [bacterium]|jgi:drug/metabolite transporter (DMT)-like permease|nr:DMT family transporter [bacterium]